MATRLPFIRLSSGAAALAMCLLAPSAPAAENPLALLDAIPAPPGTVAAAGSVTRVAIEGQGPRLTVPRYESIAQLIQTVLRPSGSVGGIDLGRMSSDPAYAAQVQARMQNMSMAEKMAFAQQMQAAQLGPGGAADSTNAVAFIGGQRGADMAAQQRMRALLDGALQTTKARHAALDQRLNAAAKACPTDSTGWPLGSCTGPLLKRSIAQHRTIEDGSLGEEQKAFAEARAIARAEVSKGRALLAQASGNGASSLTAWALTYSQLLVDYGRTITLNAGFWAYANGGKYTGQLSQCVCSTSAGDIYR